jgi:Mg-chelatase subunit ChlD
MHMNWRTKRKLSYAAAVIVPLVVIGGLIGYSVFTSPPTCFDGVQNGKETGVDCGGECERICQKTTAPVDIDWAKSFPVSDNLYNLGAYIANPNSRLEAREVPYRFQVFDPDGLLITERRGTIDILPRPETVAFESGVDTDGRKIDRVEFELLKTPFWETSELAGKRFQIQNKKLADATSTRPRLMADVANSGVREFSDLAVTAVVLDGNNRPVQLSQTKLDILPANSERPVRFTWRQSFPTRSVSCNVPGDTALVIDRSGSMNDVSQNPPEPLTSVKQAALTFTDKLGESAQSGLVTFATEASRDQRLTSEHGQTSQAIENIAIRRKDERGFTNVGAGVSQAMSVLPADTDRKQAMIILTDGKANAPKDPGGEVFARRQVNQAKSRGVSVYTIGLGDGVNQSFLQEIATDEQYFQAADSQALTEIYEAVYESLCEQAPYITEIIPTQYQLDK